MSDYIDDADLLKHQRQFLDKVERTIREANREILHERIPGLDQKSFVDMAHHVARLRAAYLQASLAATSDGDDDAWVGVLREKREAYQEARDAFEALQRAIERGYVDMGLPTATIATHAA